MITRALALGYIFLFFFSLVQKKTAALDPLQTHHCAVREMTLLLFWFSCSTSTAASVASVVAWWAPFKELVLVEAPGDSNEEVSMNVSSEDGAPMASPPGCPFLSRSTFSIGSVVVVMEVDVFEGLDNDSLLASLVVVWLSPGAVSGTTLPVVELTPALWFEIMEGKQQRKEKKKSGEFWEGDGVGSGV